MDVREETSPPLSGEGDNQSVKVKTLDIVLIEKSWLANARMGSMEWIMVIL